MMNQPTTVIRAMAVPTETFAVKNAASLTVTFASREAMAVGTDVPHADFFEALALPTRSSESTF